jgi:hypothetical protein
VSSWTAHFARLGYFLQFKDDTNGERFKRFHSHTELASTIIERRLDIRSDPLWDSFEWLLRFKFVQEAYRNDTDREKNYDKHVAALEQVERQYPDRHKAGRVIERAIDHIDVGIAEWTRLPDLKLSKKASTSCQVSVFYSYSHADEKLREELEKHLSALQRQGQIDQWHDRRIGPGQEWKGEIDEHLEKADIVLLLISPDFIASDYCYDIEMDKALAMHNAGKAVVIPIFLRSCDWSDCPFGKLQGLPKDAKPVTTWPDRDVAFTEVSKGIRNAIQRINDLRSGGTL